MCTIWEIAETIRAEEKHEREAAAAKRVAESDARQGTYASASMQPALRAGMLAALFVAMTLQGCQRAPDLAKVDADVQKAQAAGEKNIAAAQAKLDKVNADNRKDMVDAQVDARTSDNGANTPPPPNVIAPTPPPPPPPANAVVTTRADAMAKTAEATYDLEKTRADSTYDVAAARCEAQVGDSEKACKETAKAARDTTVANAKARNDAVQQSAKAAKG